MKKVLLFCLLLIPITVVPQSIDTLKLGKVQLITEHKSDKYTFTIVSQETNGYVSQLKINTIAEKIADKEGSIYIQTSEEKRFYHKVKWEDSKSIKTWFPRPFMIDKPRLK